MLLCKMKRILQVKKKMFFLKFNFNIQSPQPIPEPNAFIYTAEAQACLFQSSTGVKKAPCSETLKLLHLPI